MKQRNPSGLINGIYLAAPEGEPIGPPYPVMVLNQPACLAKTITASALIKTGPGKFYGFIVSSTNNGTITVDDHTAAGGTSMVLIMVVTAGQSVLLPAPAAFTVGLYVTITNTASITILYA